MSPEDTYRIIDFVQCGMLVRNQQLTFPEALMSAIRIVRPDIADDIDDTDLDPRLDKSVASKTLVFLKKRLNINSAAVTQIGKDMLRRNFN